MMLRRHGLVPLCGLLLLALVTRAEAASAEPVEPNVFARLGPIALHGSEPDALTLGLGAFDIGETHTSPAANLEYRFGRKLFFIGPSYGLVANTDGGLLGYVNAYIDLSYRDFYLTPQVGIGGYREGSGRDLGSIFQFRAASDLTYRFANGARLGLRFAHVSNANTADPNPGEEEIYL
ncbi:MAG TPA: acyloxyacyl hydrolase, partial [Geminicoccaceae bacterium]|nr:acyloxyacyl hydrolase [Geminicoccaceae bacterium]